MRPPRLLGLFLGIAAAGAAGFIVLFAQGLLLVLAGLHVFSLHETHVIVLVAGGASLAAFFSVSGWWVSQSLSRLPHPSWRRLRSGAIVIALGFGFILAGTAYFYVSAVTAAPENEQAPAISGFVRVGSILRADPGRWQPSDVELSFRWKRCALISRRCRWIAGARRARYRVVAADAGRRLEVAVSGRTDAGTLTIDAEPTDIVER